jgi:glycosyltransferase involved in cell wall biosynthesis
VRIAINAALAGPHATGIGVYAWSLARALPRIDADRHSYDIFVGGMPEDAEGSEHSTEHVRCHVVQADSSVRRLAWDSWGVGRAAQRSGADVLHSTSSYLPWAPPCPCVLTVHDLAIYRYPGAFRLANRTAGRRLFELSLQRAALLIAPSEATRRDVVALCGVHPEQVAVIPEAADCIFQPDIDARDLDRVRERYGLRRPYVLSVATAEPRKNLVRLLAAFRAIQATLPFACMLVLVGQEGWLTGALASEARALMRAGLLRMTGYVPRSDLPALYGGASVFAYPSLYEGFGLPVLEALACGAPALTSNCSSLPEVAGDAALLLDPTSTEALAAGLYALLTDAPRADDLRRRGPAQAARFTWEAAAEATLQVYARAQALASHPRATARHVVATGTGR